MRVQFQLTGQIIYIYFFFNKIKYLELKNVDVYWHDIILCWEFKDNFMIRNFLITHKSRNYYCTNYNLLDYARLQKLEKIDVLLQERFLYMRSLHTPLA